MIKRSFLFGVFVLLVAQLGAQPSLRAEVSRDTLLMGNTFRLTYSLENAGDVRFDPPAIKGFDLVAGPTTSSVINMFNGQVSRQVSYSYLLRARGEGDFFIPPVEVEAEGTKLRTSEIAITVLPNPDGIIQEEEPSMRRRGLDQDLFEGFSFPNMPDLRSFSFPDFPELNSFSFPGFPDSLLNSPGFSFPLPDFPAPDSTRTKKKRKIYKI